MQVRTGGTRLPKQIQEENSEIPPVASRCKEKSNFSNQYVLYGFESSVKFEAVGGGQQIIDVFLMVNLDAMELANHCQDVYMYSLFCFCFFWGGGRGKCRI